eukprot:TRINITY_DN12104_c0_g1_i1.p1 TRINITY_DN12104_c0_g1~~TRINITY_DN12104_c0_g1_i1.p1  ORF type:complete len:671 (+),score=232.33 TRINITY_DN12104_c0_g1_i1:47-2059(+)
MRKSVRRCVGRRCRAEVPYVPINQEFETARFTGDTWDDFRQIWKPEQTLLAKEKFGKIFNEYFEAVENTSVLEQLKEELAVLYASKKRLTDMRKVEFLLLSVLHAESRNRNQSLSDRAIRSGNGWTVSSRDTSIFGLDEHYPFKRRDLTQKEVTEAHKIRIYLVEKLGSIDDVMRTRMFEVNLLVSSILATYPHTPGFWEYFMRLLQGFKDRMPLTHPCTVEFILEALVAKYTDIEKRMACTTPGDAKRGLRYDAMQMESRKIREMLFHILKYLEIHHSNGHQFPHSMYNTVVMRLAAVLPVSDGPNLLLSSRPLVNTPEFIIHVIRKLHEQVTRNGTVTHINKHQLLESGLTVRSLVRSLTGMEQQVFAHEGWDTDAGKAAFYDLLFLLGLDYPSWNMKDQEAGVLLTMKVTCVMAQRGQLTTLDWGQFKVSMRRLLNTIENIPDRPSMLWATAFKEYIHTVVLMEDFPLHDTGSWRVLVKTSEWLLRSQDHAEVIDMFIRNWDGLVELGGVGGVAGPMGADHPCNVLLGYIYNPEQVRTVLGLLEQHKMQVSKETYLKLFTIYVRRELWDEAVDVLWHSSGVNAPPKIKVALTVRAAHCLCMSSYLSHVPERAHEAIKLLSNGIEAWADSVKVLDDAHGQWKAAREIFRKSIPKDLFIKVEAVAASLP